MPTVRMPAQWLGEGGPSVLPSFRPSVTILPDLAGRQVMHPNHHYQKQNSFGGRRRTCMRVRVYVNLKKPGLNLKGS